MQKLMKKHLLRFFPLLCCCWNLANNISKHPLPSQCCVANFQPDLKRGVPLSISFQLYSEVVSKICSIVKSSSQPIHIGSSSPFNKKEWVIKEWPMCNWAITVSSFLFVKGQTTHFFKTGNILCNLLSGNSSHSNCPSCNIYLLARDFNHTDQCTFSNVAMQTSV